MYPIGPDEGARALPDVTAAQGWAQEVAARLRHTAARIAASGQDAYWSGPAATAAHAQADRMAGRVGQAAAVYDELARALAVHGSSLAAGLPASSAQGGLR